MGQTPPGTESTALSTVRPSARRRSAAASRAAGRVTSTPVALRPSRDNNISRPDGCASTPDRPAARRRKSSAGRTPSAASNLDGAALGSSRESSRGARTKDGQSDPDVPSEVLQLGRVSQPDSSFEESQSTDDRSAARGYDDESSYSSMHVSDLLQQSPLSATGGRGRLRERISELCGRALGGIASGAGELDREDAKRIEGALSDDESTAEELRDAVSTALMDSFRKTSGRGESARGTFGLLYELNAAHLLVQVSGRLRRYSSKADPGDVLQEVFFNVYRYPHRFDAQREDAFRVWTAMIVRNTVLKHMRSRATGGSRHEVAFEDLSDQSIASAATPLSGVLEDEASAQAAHAYVTYLQLYIEFYSMLSDRERRALHLVEVDRVSYRDAAAALGIKLENLKMVIFRARRKIHRAMRRVFDGLSPDCKPARVGSTVGAKGDFNALPPSVSPNRDSVSPNRDSGSSELGEPRGPSNP